MPAEADLLTALALDPSDDLAWIALADCLEENGEDDRAELVRVRESLRHADRLDPKRPANEARMQALLEAGVKPAGPRLRLLLASRLPLDLTLVPPGSFFMGTDGEESGEGLTERPRHRVTITRGFWIGVLPFTQAQWRAVMRDDPSHYKGDNLPVETITWSRSKDCCVQLGKLLGGTFRLPTEAEWEYACRAATYSPFHSGHDEDALRRVGWNGRKSNEGTAPVGQLTPNAWGLHDMHGNVYEWCGDRFRTFTENDETDPFGGTGTSHCIRGGYWGRPYLSCRSAFRDSYSQGAQASIAGFRVVRNLDSTRRTRKEKEHAQ